MKTSNKYLKNKYKNKYQLLYIAQSGTDGEQLSSMKLMVLFGFGRICNVSSRSFTA